MPTKPLSPSGGRNARPRSSSSVTACSGQGALRARGDLRLHGRGGRAPLPGSALRAKDFRQRRPNGSGGWEWRLGDTRRVLFRLPKVREAASAGERVWVVEGERDVHSLEKLGRIATTCPGGAGKWRPEHSECLRGAQVVVVADRDDKGREHASQVVEALEGTAARVVAVEPAAGKDVSDHLAAGRPLGELVPIPSIYSTPRERSESNQSGRLPFASLSTALANAPAEPVWRWDGYLAPGVIALLAGRPKVGKSTLLFGLMASLMRGQPFLELSTRSTGVLLLAEEREGTLKEKEARFGLEGGAHLLMRHQLGEVTWPEAVMEARAYCQAHDLGVLVVDTFAAWVGLRGDEETKPGAVLEAILPLQEAAGDGLAVLLVHHQRKAAGAYGEAIRGSSALAGAVDVVVELERLPAAAQAEGRARVLHAVSRYSGTPEEVALELTEEGYRAVGDVSALRGRSEAERLREALLDLGGGTVPELVDATELKEATARRRLDEMLETGEVERQGTGKRGDPFRFVPRSIAGTSTPRVETKRNQSAASEQPHPPVAVPGLASVIDGGVLGRVLLSHHDFMPCPDAVPRLQGMSLPGFWGGEHLRRTRLR